MVTKTEFPVPGDYLDYFLFDGPTMKDVLVKYTDLTGKPSLPAPWTFGLWLSTSFTTNYDEDTVMSFVDGMLDRGIPLRTFHFDCFWMKEFHWSDFVWDERVFPDPEVLLDMGIDCFKTDFGERIPTENVVYYDGSDPKKMHNYYTYLYNKCVYELLERKRGKGEAVLFARSATVGGQKFPVHWGGDCWSDYVSMEESLRNG